ncbi:MAG TPA: HAMP domain-containing sensor histidine kinase [Solirubrobacteraceae bacterium]|nr:HAMP domain-containing sensor histidine kinase [Solirubrobacteraceae bacterium]
MTFTRRLTLVAAAAVAVIAVLGSVLTYVLVRGELRGEVDRSLRGSGRATQRLSMNFPPRGVGILRAPVPVPAPPFPVPPVRPGEPNLFLQIVGGNGTITRVRTGGATLPVSRRVRDVAAGRSGAFLYDARIGGEHLRVYVARAAARRAVMLGRSLSEVDRTLSRLRLILALIALAGVGLAVVLGRIVARTAVAPVQRLTETTEHVAATRDLGRRIAVEGDDELSRLARSFNAMLDSLERSTRALEASTSAQRQLVADASHELRTPVTTLRTNLEVLRSRELPPAERERLLEEIEGQIDELTVMMTDLIDLARGDEREPDAEEVRLDTLVAEAVDRARHHAPGVAFEIQLAHSVVAAVPDRLDRAVSNLLDNAVKWSPDGGPVEVRVADGEVSVRDHGPGITPADLPHVFDRFYRGGDARGRPGSGLGLAIVRQVAEAHGGSVAAEPASGGGTRLRLRLADRKVE